MRPWFPRRGRPPSRSPRSPLASIPLPSLPSLPIPSIPRLRSGPSHSDEVHNDRVMRGDSVAMGAINAASTFLPVFVARLGGSAFEVGLLTAIPAVCAVLLAIPAGQILQRRDDIVAWYSRARWLAHLSYALMAAAVLVLPVHLAVAAVLVIWAAAAVPATIGIVAFPVVMDGAAGPRGRLEMMSRRWSIMGVTSAIVVSLIGLILDRSPFPEGYALVFVGFTLAGFASWRFSRQYRVPRHGSGAPAEPLGARLRAMVGIVRAHPAFLEFSARQLVYVAGVRLTLPLIPLYLVRELDAPDAWIGIIATAQSLSLLVGYILWRRQARRRGRAFMLLITLGMSSLYPLALSLTGSLAVVAVLAAAASLFTAGVDLALFDELMDRIPRQYGVTFTSMDTTFANAATIIAPLVGAAIAETIGIHGALRAGTLVMLCGFVLFAVDIRRRHARAAHAVVDRPPDGSLVSPRQTPGG